ncbi:serine protease [Haliea sp.]|uniref:trypsin-like serine peptidase n=1 Tax=Haliea sp. TaxID=1932666 RepID=UPI003528D37C
MLSHSGKKALVRTLALQLLLPIFANAAGEDPRQQLSGQSPRWLSAIGQLSVPGLKTEQGHATHHTERCSATLIAADEAPEADLIVTAWHCLEAYRDLSKRITFTLLPGSPAPRIISARPVADGGSMAADWALLRLTEAVARADIPALALHPGLADTEKTVLMAGYSRDTGVGAGGRILSYDPTCRITRSNAALGYSDCRAHKGASGGAVIQLNDDGEPLLSGIISEGDGLQDSRFVPIAAVRNALPSRLSPPPPPRR